MIPLEKVNSQLWSECPIQLTSVVRQDALPPGGQIDKVACREINCNAAISQWPHTSHPSRVLEGSIDKTEHISKLQLTASSPVTRTQMSFSKSFNCLAVVSATLMELNWITDYSCTHNDFLQSPDTALVFKRWLIVSRLFQSGLQRLNRECLIWKSGWIQMMISNGKDYCPYHKDSVLQAFTSSFSLFLTLFMNTPDLTFCIHFSALDQGPSKCICWTLISNNNLFSRWEVESLNCGGLYELKALCSEESDCIWMDPCVSPMWMILFWQFGNSVHNYCSYM